MFKDFVEWGIRNYPGQNYCVILWSHGSGWRDQQREGLLKGICYDYQTGNNINSLQLQQAFEQIVADTNIRMEIIGMDACLMGMTEVAHSMRNFGSYIVFSESPIPIMGFPYDTFLRDLVATPTIFNEYQSEYSTLDFTTNTHWDELLTLILPTIQ